MLKTNESKIVEMVLQCTPGAPFAPRGWSVTNQGLPFKLPSIGGISLNIQAGDPAFGWAGDHLEPGVSCLAGQKRHEHPNTSLQYYACCGDTATVVSGNAKGAKGTVLGHHGGSEHIIVDFAPSAKAKMTYDDKIIIKAKGQGLELTDYPGITLFSMNPKLLKKMKIKTLKNRKLSVPVTTIIPAACMGSGLGTSSPETGDYDVMTSDIKTVKKYNLDKMRFGDFVAIMDHKNNFGPTYLQGAVTIGIVIHSDCKLAGHGPGVTVLMTADKPLIEPVISKAANIADLLQIGNRRKKK